MGLKQVCTSWSTPKAVKEIRWSNIVHITPFSTSMVRGLKPLNLEAVSFSMVGAF